MARSEHSVSGPRAGAPHWWSRNSEGQELLQEAETLGPLLFKESDRVQFIKRCRIIVSLQGLGNRGHSNPPHQGKIISLGVKDC